MSTAALLVLASSGGIYLVAAACAALGLGLAVMSQRLPQRLGSGRYLRFAAAFVTINVAVLDGWSKFLSGRGDVTWQHDRLAGR